MNQKILVVLEVPSISKCYEMYVPVSLTVKELTSLLIKTVKELSGQLYVSSGTEFLCIKEQDVFLESSDVLKDYCIGNGEHLILL